MHSAAHPTTLRFFLFKGVGGDYLWQGSLGVHRQGLTRPSLCPVAHAGTVTLDRVQLACPFGSTVQLQLSCGRVALAESLPLVFLSVHLKRVSANASASLSPSVSSGSPYDGTVNVTILSDGAVEANDVTFCRLLGDRVLGVSESSYLRAALLLDSSISRERGVSTGCGVAHGLCLPQLFACLLAC